MTQGAGRLAYPQHGAPCFLLPLLGVSSYGHVIRNTYIVWVKAAEIWWNNGSDINHTNCHNSWQADANEHVTKQARGKKIPEYIFSLKYIQH
jgi:hypothetical protein